MRINWNAQGFRDILTSPGAVEAVRAEAERVDAAAGAGYAVTVPAPHTRARAQVWAVSSGAKRDALQNHTLLRVLR